MSRNLTVGAALSALMLSAALAQTPSTTPSPGANPPASAPPAATAPMPAAPMASQPDSGKLDVVMSQKPDQWLASRFKGTDVVGPDDKKIGDVTDILLDKTGKIEAFIVSVGGFLGMGAKDVALAPSSFEVIAGLNGGADKLKLSANQDQLKQAENFVPYQPPRATTTGSGSPAGMRPSSNTGPTAR